MDEDARRIYAIVAILQTYDQEAYLSLISRTAEISPDIIMEMIKDGDLRDLVIYEEKEDNILRVSQKLIAEIVTDEAYPSARDIKQILLKIISSITPNNVRAMNMLHSLLIKRIKDGLNIRHLQVQDKIELFKAAISNVIESRTLLHHLAILYLSDGMTKECRIYIRRALECTNLQFSEAKRNVFDTQGRLELAEARIESENGDHDAATLHFITAENFFKESQGYPMESPHSYQGQAETYFEWSKGPIDILNKEQLLVLCLSICSNYIDLTSDSLNPMFLSLRTKSLEHLRTLGFDVNGAKQVASTYKNADGFAYFAEIELDNGNTDNALRLVNEGLTYNLGSNWLNRLKIKLIKIRFPNDSKLLGKSLDEWLKNSESSSNIALKFEYAKFKYMNGEEKEALSLFQGISSPKILDIYANHPQHEIWSVGIDRKEFIGKITKVPVADEVGYVKYNSMQFKEKIMVPFSSLKFTPRRNNDVRFNVAFSLSGPYAVNIRSMS